MSVRLRVAEVRAVGRKVCVRLPNPTRAKKKLRARVRVHARLQGGPVTKARSPRYARECAQVLAHERTNGKAQIRAHVPTHTSVRVPIHVALFTSSYIDWVERGKVVRVVQG